MNASLYVHTDNRTRGILPVRRHLRPAASVETTPVLWERDDEGFLPVCNVDFAEADAVQVGGEA